MADHSDIYTSFHCDASTGPLNSWAAHRACGHFKVGRKRLKSKIKIGRK